MPPKGKAKPPEIIIDGVNTADLTREQLEVFALKLKEQLDREREQRNYFQLEKDKIRTFWEITRNELDEIRTRLRNKDREIEVSIDENGEKISKMHKKIKHLQYEHETKISELKTEMMMSLKQAQDDHAQQEEELLRDKKNLKQKLREQENCNSQEIQTMKLQQSEEVYEERKHFEQLAKETESKYEKMYETLRQELNMKQTLETSEIEERKNKHVFNLIEDHNKAFTNMKNYYNDITLNNLALINSLREQTEELTKLNERMNKQVNDTAADNKKLVEPLKQATAETTELKRQLQNYEKDKMALANTKLKLTSVVGEYEDLKWANNALELRAEKLQADRDDLQKKFTQGIFEVQQRTGLKNMLLQEKISHLEHEVSCKDATLGDLIAAAQLQPFAVNQKLEALLKRKNTAIKDLQYELARVVKAHDDLLQTYESKLLTYGIPLQELGFTPFRIVPENHSGITKGPAGLITKNK